MSLPDIPEPRQPTEIQAETEGESSLQSHSFQQVLLDGLKEFLRTILPALILALLLTHFVAEGQGVLGYSMEPNLHTGQRLVIEKLSYRFSGPRRGDIVVADVEGAEIPLIKRVIGLPGEMLEIKQNKVFIDGQPLEEPYLAEGVIQREYGPITIPVGHVFVMGDNRAVSQDSRYYGTVPVDHLIGRAWICYWPFKDIGPVE